MCHLVVRKVLARIEASDFSDMFLQGSEEWEGWKMRETGTFLWLCQEIETAGD